MIKSFSVKNLNSRISVDLAFHADVNVMTGRNGSGKTTILKLLWFLISGNLERVFPGMLFDECELQHTAFTIKLTCFDQPIEDQGTQQTRSGTHSPAKPQLKRSVKVEMSFTDGSEPISQTIDETGASAALNALNHSIIKYSTGSLFFPTFRRLEGGFDPTETAQYRGSVTTPQFRSTAPSDLNLALSQLSGTLSVTGPGYSHRFIASLSAHDLVQLMTNRYTDISRQTNALHSRLSGFIESRVNTPDTPKGRSPKSDTSQRHGSAGKRASAVLAEIAAQVHSNTKQRDKLLQPFTSLSDVCNQLFDRGISITNRLIIGKQNSFIDAGRLSGGEKQMLSFLAYNALFRGIPIVIDEPELSLHVDWQRQLLPLLLHQGSGNQFIIATHSPFIYSKYPERELTLGADRGD